MPDSNLDHYLAWRRLTNNGRRGRDEMSPESQAEYDALGITTEAGPDPEQAKRAYEEAVRHQEEIKRRSGPASGA